jgi:hypothetical protein
MNTGGLLAAFVSMRKRDPQGLKHGFFLNPLWRDWKSRPSRFVLFPIR